jgi:predicted nucleotidyltransferase
MTTLIEQNQRAIADLCRRFGVRKLELFGSAATGAFDPARSDLDFIVEFPPEYDFGPWLSRLSQFQRSLAQLFGGHVDLIMPSALRNPWFRREADKARVILYHAS